MAPGEITQIDAVEVAIDTVTGNAISIKRINCSNNKIKEEKVSEKEN